ncbi:MAG: DUF1569 domain-containing protein [Aeoliella sp.]
MGTLVETKKVTGRRELHFATIDEVLAEAERLASGPVTQLGNWSLGEMCDHLARSLDSATDDNQFKPGLLFKIIGPFLKKTMITKTIPAGFKQSENMKPIFAPTEGTTTEAGLARLRTAVERFKAGPLPERSPTFGKMSRDDWHNFHCRHAEMHLSFILPGN